MANKLKRFWANPKLWPICFSILFGYDAANISMDQGIDKTSLLNLFSKRKVAYPESLVIVTSMLQHGLKDVMKQQDDGDSRKKDNGTNEAGSRVSDPSIAMDCKGMCAKLCAVGALIN